MNWFKILKIRTKIAFLAFAGISGFLIYFSYGVLISSTIVSNIESIRSKHYPVLLILQSLNEPLSNIRFSISEAVSLEDIDILESNSIEKDFDDVISRFEQIKHLSPDLIKKSVKLSRLFQAYYTSAKLTSETIINGQTIEKNLHKIATMNKNFQDLVTAIKVVTADRESFLTHELDDVENNISKYRVYGIIVGTCVFLFLIFLFLIISRQINEAINYTTSIANRIADHDFDVDIEYNDKNETGLLLTAINTMRDNLRSNIRWQKATNDFINSLGNVDVSLAINNASDEIFRELNLLGLALYTSSETGDLKPQYITSHSQNTTDSRKLIKDDFAGKVFQTNKIQEIIGPFSEDSFKISISIGTILPSHIIGWPVFSDVECVGVLVLFSSHTLNKVERSYLTDVSARLGGRISSYKLEENHLHLIKDLKAKSKELEIASEESRMASKAKGEFLAMMSHEIRTPMNGVIGMTGLLLKTELTKKQRHYSDTTMKSAEALLTIINDILDFSKIEAGKMELESLPFDLQMLMEDVCELIAMRCRDKNLELLLRYKPGVPRFAIGDPGRVRQILLNLLSNSIKFTDKGYILVTVDAEPTVEDVISFNVTVQDTGIGIPQDKISSIFNKFDQADGSTTRKYGGTGLGLAITRQLCQMMGGDTTLSSELGVGSTFGFNIKLLKSKQEITPIFSDDYRMFYGLKCLIVDDTETAQIIITEQLEELKLNIKVESSAEDALATLIESIKENDPFDIVITDYHMPEMDGEMFAIQIQAKNLLAEGALIFVTSSSRRGDSNHLKSIGFDGYLVKPTRTSELAQILAVIWSAKLAGDDIPLVTRHTIHQATVDRRKRPEFKNADILLVEDNPVNQMVATEMLEALGCTITPAGNGLEALDMIHQRSFDLIFMDCQMPEMDGFEATKQIRIFEKKTNIERNPIVAFTANAMKGDEQLCLNAGMDDYITKPISDDAIEGVLVKWLSHKLVNVDKKSSEDKKQVVEVESVDVNELEILDLLPFNKLKQLFKDKFPDALAQNKKSIDKNVNKAVTSFEKNDLDGLKLSMHSLKSSSRQFGAMKLGDIAEQLETCAKNKTTDAIGNLLEQLEVVQQQTLKKIEDQTGS